MYSCKLDICIDIAYSHICITSQDEICVSDAKRISQRSS